MEKCEELHELLQDNVLRRKVQTNKYTDKYTNKYTSRLTKTAVMLKMGSTDKLSNCSRNVHRRTANGQSEKQHQHLQRQ